MENAVTAASAVLGSGPIADTILFCGDFFDRNSDRPSEAPSKYVRWGVTADQARPEFGDVAWTMVSGNHDPGYFDTCIAEHFQYTDNDNYGCHSFDYGNVHVATLPHTTADSDEKNAAFNSKVKSWLQNDLAAAQGATWRILVVHMGPYTTGDHGYAVSSSYIQDFTGICAQYKVDLVLQGHDHTYSKTLPYLWSGPGYTQTENDSTAVNLTPATIGINGQTYYDNPEGTVYVSAGCAGDRVGENTDYASTKYTNRSNKIVTDTVKVRSSYASIGADGSKDVGQPMFAVLTIDGDTLEYDWYVAASATPELFDTLRIAKTPPEPPPSIETEFNGAVVTTVGAVVDATDPSGDLILIYTNTAAPGSLTLQQEESARILVVGGGGGGASGKKGSSRYYGDGGSGGQGVDESIDLPAGSYAITVGKGGAGILGGTSDPEIKQGEDGRPSAFAAVSVTDFKTLEGLGGAKGSDASHKNADSSAGADGFGVSGITGEDVVYGAAGPGVVYSSSDAAGSKPGTDGTAGTGAGGGGAGCNSMSGAGASGIVVVRLSYVASIVEELGLAVNGSFAQLLSSDEPTTWSVACEPAGIVSAGLGTTMGEETVLRLTGHAEGTATVTVSRLGANGESAVFLQYEVTVAGEEVEPDDPTPPPPVEPDGEPGKTVAVSLDVGKSWSDFVKDPDAEVFWLLGSTDAAKVSTSINLETTDESRFAGYTVRTTEIAQKATVTLTGLQPGTARVYLGRYEDGYENHLTIFARYDVTVAGGGGDDPVVPTDLDETVTLAPGGTTNLTTVTAAGAWNVFSDSSCVTALAVTNADGTCTVAISCGAVCERDVAVEIRRGSETPGAGKLVKTVTVKTVAADESFVLALGETATVSASHPNGRHWSVSESSTCAATLSSPDRVKDVVLTLTATNGGEEVITLYQKGETAVDPVAARSVRVRVKPAVTVVTLPTAGGSLTYGQPLEELELTGGAATVEGTFTWTAPSMRPSAGGSVPVEVTFTPTGDAAELYSPVTFTIMLSVAKRVLTVTPDDAEIVAGEAIPDNAYALSGLADGDSADTVEISGAPTYESEYDPENPVVGEYAFSIKDVSRMSSANYTFVAAAAPAVVTVGRRPVTVMAGAASKTYGDTDPDSFPVTVSGLLNGDTVSYELSRAAGENAGTYEITPTGAAEQGNYTVTFVKGTFTIDPKPITSATAASQPYAGSTLTPVLTVKADAFDVTTYTVGSWTTSSGTACRSVGTHTATVTGTGNFAGELPVTFEIVKATYDMSGVKMESVTVTYDGAKHSIVVGGLPKNVSVQGWTNNGMTDVGTYQVTATFTTSDSSHYETPAPMSATLVIEPAPIKSAVAEPQTWDGTKKTPNVIVKAGALSATITNGWRLADAVVEGRMLSGGTVVRGWFDFGNLAETRPSASGSFAATFRPLDADRFESAALQVAVTVEADASRIVVNGVRYIDVEQPLGRIWANGGTAEFLRDVDYDSCTFAAGATAKVARGGVWIFEGSVRMRAVTAGRGIVAEALTLAGDVPADETFVSAKALTLDAEVTVGGVLAFESLALDGHRIALAGAGVVRTIGSDPLVIAETFAAPPGGRTIVETKVPSGYEYALGESQDDAAFRTWCEAKGIDYQTALASPGGFFSFATDQAGLVDPSGIDESQVEVKNVEVDNGGIRLTVGIDGLPVGKNAQAEYLEKVFGVMGSETLADFAADKVKYGNMQNNGDGTVSYTAEPNVEPKPDTFFFRATVAK